MPKVADDTLKDNGVYLSQKKASMVYTGEGVNTLIKNIENDDSLSPEQKAAKIEEIRSKQKIQSIRLRVPFEWKELIEARAKVYPKENSKGKRSVNTYICDLIAKDLGIDYGTDQD